MDKFWVQIAVVLLLLVPVATAQAGIDSNDQNKIRKFDSFRGIEYVVSMYDSNTSAIIVARNPTEKSVNLAGVNVRVDRRLAYNKTLNLSAGETWKHRINLSRYLKVTKRNHTVTFSTFGGGTTMNFNRSVEYGSQTASAPYIEDVEVADGIIDGERSAVANVTVANPSIHTYSTKLMVYTTGTDGSFYGASVPPGENITISAELLDERGSKVAGEARLYNGNLTENAGITDQVEFVGRAGNGTEVWNESYDPVRPPWMSEQYRYRNDSVSPGLAERVSGGYEVYGVPVVYLLGGLLVVALLFGRFR